MAEELKEVTQLLSGQPDDWPMDSELDGSGQSHSEEVGHEDGAGAEPTAAERHKSVISSSTIGTEMAEHNWTTQSMYSVYGVYERKTIFVLNQRSKIKRFFSCLKKISQEVLFF